MRSSHLFVSLVSLTAVPFVAPSAQETVKLQEYEVPWGREGRPRDPAVAPDGSIFFVGQAGKAPVGNYIARLDPKTGDFKKWDLVEGTNPHNCIVDKDGIVWYAGNRNGTIGRLDPKTGDIKTYPMPDSTVRDPHTMIFDKDGNIWFTAQGSNAIGHFNVKTGKIRIVKPPIPAGSTRRSTNPYGIALDSKGRPWVNLFATNLIATVDPATMELTTYPLASDSTLNRRIAITSDDKIWYADYRRGFLGRFDPVTKKTEEFRLPGGPNSMPYGMTVDDQDRLWVAETGKQPVRLVGFDPKTKSFFSVTELPGERNSVRYMVYDKKTKQLWYGADAGKIGSAPVGMSRVAM
jgi:virginiamycin B lyase